MTDTVYKISYYRDPFVVYVPSDVATKDQAEALAEDIAPFQCFELDPIVEVLSADEFRSESSLVEASAIGLAMKSGSLADIEHMLVTAQLATMSEVEFTAAQVGLAKDMTSALWLKAIAKAYALSIMHTVGRTSLGSHTLEQAVDETHAQLLAVIRTTFDKHMSAVAALQNTPGSGYDNDAWPESQSETDDPEYVPEPLPAGAGFTEDELDVMTDAVLATLPAGSDRETAHKLARSMALSALKHGFN